MKPVMVVALSLMFGNFYNVLRMFGECSVFYTTSVHYVLVAYSGELYRALEFLAYQLLQFNVVS